MLVQPKSDALNTGVIQAGLNTQHLGQSLHIVTETSSTNTLGLTLAESGEPHGTVILAEHQTAGSQTFNPKSTATVGEHINQK